MPRDGVLARSRMAAEASMADVCTIRRVTGQSAPNPVTGLVTDTYLSPDPYTGPCRVQQHQASADQHDAGQDQVFMLRLEVQLPVVTSAGLEVGDEITVTAAVNDPDLVGRTFRIHDLAHASEKTARRVQCVERTGS